MGYIGALVCLGGAVLSLHLSLVDHALALPLAFVVTILSARGVLGSQ